MKQIILASSSPRRQEILKNLHLDFRIIPSLYKEKLDNDIFEYKKIENLAYNKALSVLETINYDAIIVAADTVVVLDNKILGKPKNKEHAFEMLNMLSGKEHFVVTSICLIDVLSKRKKISSTTSYVEFNNLTEEMIKDYINNYNPLDKAGAYGIQELPSGFIKNINGSFENIVGLCPKSLNKLLSKLL